jgi:hypothetical protein
MFEKIATTPGIVFEAEEPDYLGMTDDGQARKNVRKSGNVKLSYLFSLTILCDDGGFVCVIDRSAVNC